jgi:hypothetical protein
MNLIEVTVDLSRFRESTLNFSVTYASNQALNVFRLEALANRNGVEVLHLAVRDDAGQPVDFTLQDQFLHIQASTFRLDYAVKTRYPDCVGADREIEMIYPFINPDEVFFGTGVLAHPQDLPQIEVDLSARFKVAGLPAGWTIFSNLPGEAINPAHLNGFFLYAASTQPPEVFTYVGQDRMVTFRLLVQRGKTIPVAPDTLRQFIEDYIALYRQADEINILFLQAPANFQELTANRAFATGENVLNGIVTYTPNNPAYLERLFGHGDYTFYLYDGLTHEIMHFYTSTSWQARYKSVLYPGPVCPPADAQLIGEALNLYFSRQYVYRHLFGSNEQFFTDTVAQAFSQHRNRPRKNPLLELLILDMHLRVTETSLLALYSYAIHQKQQDPTPYTSAVFLFDMLAQKMGIQAYHLYESLFQQPLPDYPTLVEDVLTKVGYRLVERTDNLELERQQGNGLTPFALPS